MSMNTSQYIPYESVSGIILESPEHPECLFLSGTGFFAYFPPYENVFFITARHCVLDNEGNLMGNPKIPYSPNDESKEVIPFSCYLETEYSDDENGREDIVVYVVDDVPDNKKRALMRRALRLQHQDDAKTLLNCFIAAKEKIRTVGFPSVSKSIDYDNNLAVFHPRGFHADLVGEAQFRNWYRFENISWKEGPLDGFSGSPILALCPTSQGEVAPIPIGILLTTSHFLAINVATDLIAMYLTQANKAN
jgi:hypothetical protein